VFDLLQDRVLPETLDVYFRSPSVWPELAAISTGTNVRRKRLHPSAFLDFKIPLPSMKSQIQLRAIKAKADVLMKLESETGTELDALMPSILSRAFRGEL
jgi:type I restriction enzyme S subunit